MINQDCGIKNRDRWQRAELVITSLQEALTTVVVVYRWGKKPVIFVNKVVNIFFCLDLKSGNNREVVFALCIRS